MSTTIANAATVEHAWFVIDAEDQILGRLATRVATALRGKPLTDENIRAAAALVKDAVDPLEDFRGSAEYKTDMAEVFTRRAVEQAMVAISART